MTREEAINICKREQYCASHSECPHEECPWNENCPDDAPFDSEIQEAFQMAIEALSAQQWISVSERLPDREGEYLVTWGTINVRSMCVLHYDQFGDWTDEYDNVMDGSNVIAWMPIPEPFKGETE